MATEDEKPISLLEFSRRKGCDNSTVHDYIAKGKIYGAALGKSAGGKVKLYFELASQQFDASRANTEHLFARSGAAALGVNNRAPKKPPASPSGKRGYLSPEQNDQLDRLLNLGAESDPERPAPRRPQPHGGDLKSGKDRVEADISGTETMTEAELSKLDIAQLTKKEAVLRVLARQLELKEKQGEVVSKQVVYDILFVAGQELRNRVEAVPTRCVDDVLAAEDRTASLLVMQKEINDALSGVADLVNTELTKRNTANAQ